MKKLIIIAAIAIAFASCKKTPQGPTEATYRVVLTSTANNDGKWSHFDVNVNGHQFVRDAYHTTGFLLDTSIVAHIGKDVKYHITDNLNNGFEWEPDNGGIVSITVYDEKGNIIKQASGKKELVN